MARPTTPIPLVYVETTVWSFALATDSPDLTEATHAFFDACRAGQFSTVIGPPVLREIERADEGKREELLELIRGTDPRVLERSSSAEQLASEFLRVGAVPPSKPDDAAHVAYAFAVGADVLVSWNFKHIASLRRAEKFNAAALLSGFAKRLIITTPPEALYGDDSTDTL